MIQFCAYTNEKMSTRTFFFIIILFLDVILVNRIQARMTDKQLVAAVKLVRNMCQGKTKAATEEIEKMHQGNWDVDHNAQMDQENHFDRKSAEVQLAQLPNSLVDYVSRCLDKCENAATRFDDKCFAAWEYSKCMYFCDPEQYFLP